MTRLHARVGFTIVELLLVVSIIAILATITIVAYNGITTHATNTKIISNVKSYVTIFEMYHSLNGEYPPVPDESHTSVNMVCLGLGYHGGTCGKVTGETVYESNTFMDELHD